MIFSRVLHVFGRAPGSRPALTVICLFLAGVFDVLGMSLIIPLLNAMSGKGGHSSSALSIVGSKMLAVFGASQDPGPILAFIAAALTVKSLFVLAAMTYVSFSVAEVGFNFRRNLLEALLRSNLRHVSAQIPARIADALVNDVAEAANAFNQAALAMAEMLKIGAILIVAYLISGWVLFAILLAAAGSGYVVRSFMRVRSLAYQNQREVSTDLLSRANEIFVNIKVLKGMSRLRPFQDRLGVGISAVRKSVLLSQSTRHALNAAQDILLIVALCAGIYAGLTWLGISIAEMIVLATLFFLMSNSLRTLQGILHLFRDADPAFDACERLLHDARENEEQDGGSRKVELKSGCVFTDVSFDYDGKSILENATFELAAGKITVIEGPSGVGKTTTIDLLIGFHKPRAGSITVDGVPLAELSLQEWRAGVGYVPQDLTLVEGSIFENIALGDPLITRETALDAMKTAGAGAFVDSLPKGLDTPVGAMGARLSGGERQRISLARALAAKPRLLILDEVTSSLDLETEHNICEAIARLSPPLTVVAITHRPAWTEIAAQILRIENQKVTTLPGRRQPTAPEAPAAPRLQAINQ